MALLLTVFGIGFLLLIHEAGHYFAARFVGIRVLEFSLGFGPRILRWQGKACTFRLAWIPLGGYVRVAGEDPEQKPKPGDLFYASAPKRLLFYSGGILMNFLFAFLLIPILFLVGVPFEAPVVGSVQPGAVAWQAGIQRGDRILEVQGRSIYGFRNIHSAIALAPKEMALTMLVQAPGEEPRNVSLTPNYDQEKGFQGIGIGPLMELTFANSLHKQFPHSNILRIQGIPVEQTSLLAAVLERAQTAGDTLTIEFADEGGEIHKTQLQAQPIDLADAPPQLGISPMTNKVDQVRGGLANWLHPGDIILEVNHQSIRNLQDILLAVHEQGGLKNIQLHAEKEDKFVEPNLLLSAEEVTASLALKPSDEVQYTIYPGSAADKAGLKDGCRILRVNQQPVRSFEELRGFILDLSANANSAPKVHLNWVAANSSEIQSCDFQLAPIPRHSYELTMQVVQEEVVVASPIRAVRLGFQEASNMVSEVLTTVKRMSSGAIASKNLGGIITIGTATHSFASQGFIPLLFFLCMISVNLGVLNLLPIPALDGGHILFALFEILVRRPINMAVQNAFQVVGVFIVLFFLIFVTTMDIQRLFQ